MPRPGVRCCEAGATRRSGPSSSSRSSTRCARPRRAASATTSSRRCATTRPPGCRWCPTSLPCSRTRRRPPADRDLQRRATYDAVVAALRRLAAARPLVLVLDDLQDAGAATVDLLGYLARQLGTSRVLLVGAVRSEDRRRSPSAWATARRGSSLGPLDPAAVGHPGGRAGLGAARWPGHGAHRRPHAQRGRVPARARGAATPASLPRCRSGLLARVDRLGPESRSVVEAGAVLRRRLDPRLLAGLAEVSEVAATRHGEELTRGGLFVRSGAVYEFANDLFQECVYAALPEAVATAYHRRAADLTSDRPEVMATHAHAVGDDARAARGWLLAGEEALRRAAVEDARTLVERCLGVPGLAGETRARALLVRGRVHEAGTSWTAAIQDIDAALAWARTIGERRLELAALRARGGDAAVGAQLVRRRAAGPARGRRTTRLRAGRPPGRGRLRQPPHGARGEPAATERRERAGGPGGRASAGVRVAGRSWCWRSTASRRSRGTSGTRPPLPRPCGSSSRSCGRATTPGCSSGWCSSRRSCRPPTVTGTRRGGCCTTRSTSTGAAASRPTPATSRPTTAGWPGSPATSTTRAASVAGPSRRPRPSTTRGGTRGRRVCWPRRSSRRARRRRRSPLPGPGWPR